MVPPPLLPPPPSQCHGFVQARAGGPKLGPMYIHYTARHYNAADTHKRKRRHHHRGSCATPPPSLSLRLRPLLPGAAPFFPASPICRRSPDGTLLAARGVAGDVGLWDVSGLRLKLLRRIDGTFRHVPPEVLLLHPGGGGQWLAGGWGWGGGGGLTVV